VFRKYEITQSATDDNPIQKDYLNGTGENRHWQGFYRGDITLPFPELITSRATFTAANGDKIF
jgi:hypothetical protein